MQKAFEFLNQNRDVAFATSENNIPKIRVFQIMRLDGRTLYFATSPKKEVYRQLRDNPEVELLAMKGNISVRVSGKGDFSVEDSIQQRIYEGSSILKRLYPDYKSLVYFKMAIHDLDYYNLTPTPPEILHKHYD